MSYVNTLHIEVYGCICKARHHKKSVMKHTFCDAGELTEPLALLGYPDPPYQVIREEPP